MRSFGSLLFIIVACGLGLLWGMDSSAGQVIVVGAGDDDAGGFGEFVIEGVGCESGAFAHVFALQEDNDWTNAKAKLLELAGNGERISVICALETVNKNADEKHQTRIQSVITALTESGAYPLTMTDFASESKRLEVALQALKGAKTVKDNLATVLMALDRACDELDCALKAGVAAGEQSGSVTAPARAKMPGESAR